MYLKVATLKAITAPFPFIPTGPHGIRQVTYGRSQTTAYGTLEELIKIYAGGNGIYSAQLQSYIARIGIMPLVDNEQFKQLLAMPEKMIH
jgi:hypothetical protein